MHRRKVRLQDTDATGVLYFPEQLKMALEVFEDFLSHHEISWRHLIDSPYLLPVVHAEADYLAPVMVGDELEIYLTVQAVGTKSVTLSYRLVDPKRQLDVGTAKIIHVAVDKETRTSVPLPDFLRTILTHE